MRPWIYDRKLCGCRVKSGAYMLLTGHRKNQITIETPGGISYTAEIIDIHIGEHCASCAVVKDGGDDPDVTTGMKIYSKVSLTEEAGRQMCSPSYRRRRRCRKSDPSRTGSVGGECRDQSCTESDDREGSIRSVRPAGLPGADWILSYPCREAKRWLREPSIRDLALSEASRSSEPAGLWSR